MLRLDMPSLDNYKVLRTDISETCSYQTLPRFDVFTADINVTRYRLIHRVCSDYIHDHILYNKLDIKSTEYLEEKKKINNVKQ